MSRAHPATSVGVLVFDSERIDYEVVRSDRRTLAVTVLRDGSVRVRSPQWLPVRAIEQFMQERAPWIARKRAEASAREAGGTGPLTPGELRHVRVLFADRFDRCWEEFARPGEVKPTLRVRVMRTRWGSFSTRGSVTLNSVLVRATLDQLDYVIFHELCHMRVRGHGPDFYAEVARHVPEWKARRAELRKIPI